MIYFQLFFTFFYIGAVSFGGGYGMMSLIREAVLHYEWLDEETFLDLAAVSESTPGPIAINMATFVGAEQGGFAGALCATLGAVLPSFILVLIIVALSRNLLKYKGVAAFLDGVRPAVAGLIVAAAAVMLLGILFGVRSFTAAPVLDGSGILMFAVIASAALLYKKLRGKGASPILSILLSAVLGLLLGVIRQR